MDTCCSTVSTPSRSGSSTPRRSPLETMTPKCLGSSCSMPSTGSGSESTSTENTTLSSSPAVMGGKRGSCVEARTAFSMISRSRDGQAGARVPMQPRSAPSFCLMETKQAWRPFQRGDETTSSPLFGRGCPVNSRLTVSRARRTGAGARPAEGFPASLVESHSALQ